VVHKGIRNPGVSPGGHTKEDQVVEREFVQVFAKQPFGGLHGGPLEALLVASGE